jgi:signal transduction histidine kinase/DNA-binding response OmpR family regulator/HPt (histidine-containing phosphotransfer) domain-containing protein
MDILYSNPAARLFANAWENGECEELVRKLKSPNPPREHTLLLDHYNAPRWIRISISEGTFGDFPAFFLWIIDISTSKESESRLQQMVEEADAAAEIKSNFLATMSHEIRTPMQSVYGLLELIGEEKPPENIMAMVNTAKTSASGLLEILDDILDLAKMDADKLELDVFEVPVRTLVRGIIEALAVKAHGKKVVIVDDIEETVPFVIIGDPKRLRQILMNLMGNAVKFTGEGTVTVRVTTDTKVIENPAHGLGLRFEIIDTGVGMSKEAASKLFTPFTQADSSTSRKFGGTGLGLSICKKLVELMGGSIGVNSEENRGSTFWFEIPTEEVGTESSTLDMPSLDGISVLSVEDHPQGAKEIVRSLHSMGASVDSASTYAEGLDLVKRKPYDVGVIDQGLPDGLGLDLIKEIMNLRPAMGLIMYTVRDDVGLAHSLQSLGVKYLTKPASRAGLGEAEKEASQATRKIDIDGPSRLLIAEDTQSVRYVLERQLEKLGIEADFVEDGEQALKALESGEYGILFTDLHMPGIDGYEVARIIREKEHGGSKHFPVVVLTADVQMAQRHVYMTYGFDESLVKPVTMGQFRRLLIRWGLLSEDNLSQAVTETADNIPERTSDGKVNAKGAIDREAMAALMGAFDDEAVKMLKMFTEMTSPLIDDIKKAHKNGDNYRLKELAHSLKGAARSACAARLGDLAEELQDKAQAEGPCEDLVQNIMEEFDNVREEIERL